MIEHPRAWTLYHTDAAPVVQLSFGRPSTLWVYLMLCVVTFDTWFNGCIREAAFRGAIT